MSASNRPSEAIRGALESLLLEIPSAEGRFADALSDLVACLVEKEIRKQRLVQLQSSPDSEALRTTHLGVV